MINKVLNVLTLVAALVVLGGAYMLFGKRTLLLKRGDVLAKEVQTVAASLDQGSGTEVAASLKEADLNHKKFGDDELLKKLAPKVAALSKQAQEVIAQRDALAAVVAETAGKLKIEGVETANLQTIASSADESVKFTGGIDKTIKRDELIVSSIGSVAEAAGVEVNADSLNSLDEDKIKTEMTALQETVTDAVERKNAFADHIGQVAQILEVESPTVDGDEYADELLTTVGNITEFKNKLEEVQTTLSTTKENLAEREDEVAETEDSIVALKAKIAAQEQKVAELQSLIDKSIGETGNAEATKKALAEIETLSQDYYEMLKLVRGRIIKVNDKWEFAVINVGSKSKIYKSVGELTTEFEAAVPEGEVMDITRSVDGSQEFVAQFQITKVFDDYAVGNIISKSETFDAAVGDDVYFSNETVAAMKLEKEQSIEGQKAAALKKLEEEKAAAKAAAEDADEVVEDELEEPGELDELDDMDELEDVEDDSLDDLGGLDDLDDL